MTFHDLFQDTLNVFTTLDEEVGFKTPQRSFFFLFAILKKYHFQSFFTTLYDLHKLHRKNTGEGELFSQHHPFYLHPPRTPWTAVTSRTIKFFPFKNFFL